MSANIIVNGKQLNVPKDFFDVGVKASFGENIQSNLTTEEFTFVLDSYKEIIDWINSGRNGGVGIFEGIPLSIIKSDAVNNVSIFNGIIDLQNGVEIQENLRQVKARIRQDESLNQLDDLIEPLDFRYLYQVGTIKNSDFVRVDYVVNKVDNTLENITTLITVYLLSKQLADSIKDIGETVATISGIGASGVTGPVGATIYSVATAILQVAYSATLLVLIVDFGTDLIRNLLQPIREHKGITVKTMLLKTCQHMGFGFNSTIDELDKIVYLPSNQNVDEFGAKNILKAPGTIKEGIPNASDFGYSCKELFEAVRNIFNGRFAILNNVVEFHSENSAFWIKNSSWIKPKIRKEIANTSYRFNTEELNSSLLIQFQTDIVDAYTIKNYKGTAYQVLTNEITTEKPLNKTIKGAKRIDIPYALGNRKDSLNALESSLASLANLFDSLASVFGGNPNLSNKVKSKVGVLEVSENNHTVPKLLYMQDGRIPSNHRDLWSAKVLYDKYYVYYSFVQNGFEMQRRVYENETLPFGLSDFVKLLNNSYFRDENGTLGKVVDLQWNFSKDEAILSYWIQDVYTKNLQETFIEPE